MAMTVRAQSQKTNTSRPVAEDSAKSTSDEKVPLIRSTSSSTESECSDDEVGSPSKCKVQPKHQKFSRSISSLSLKGQSKEVDAKEFSDKRTMTPMQERFNAVTMIPGMIYCVYYIMAECWLTASDDQQGSIQGQETEDSQWINIARDAFDNQNNSAQEIGCLDSQAFPYLTVAPPLTVVAGAVGLFSHSPFSMLYHWKCATTLEPSKRIPHWSRRLDSSFIHFASVLASYATSGRMDYFLLNAVFNIDCAYRQFEEEVRPKRNLTRIATSILLYLLPVLVCGHFDLFLQFFIMFGICGWLFVGYPFGGWSHGIFHLVLSTLPHLVMTVAMRLESSQLQVSLAEKCAGVTG